MAKFLGEMVERIEPRFVKFEDAGDMIEGRLVKIERIKTEGGTAARYTVEQPDFEEVCFLGVHQIDSKVRMDDKGHYIKVIYGGESKTVSKSGNAMKEFAVKVSKKLVVRDVDENFSEFVVSTTGVEICDADIPF
jgi:hypothetical protein